MAEAFVWIAKIVLVVALLGVAAALATPKGRLPLALRGRKRILDRDRNRPADDGCGGSGPSATKRFVAFVLVVLAVLVVVL